MFYRETLSRGLGHGADNRCQNVSAVTDRCDVDHHQCSQSESPRAGAATPLQRVRGPSPSVRVDWSWTRCHLTTCTSIMTPGSLVLLNVPLKALCLALIDDNAKRGDNCHIREMQLSRQYSINFGQKGGSDSSLLETPSHNSSALKMNNTDGPIVMYLI